MAFFLFGDSLKRFLTVNFLLVALLPALVMGGASLYFMDRHLNEGIVQRNFVLARSLASEVDIFVEEPLSLLHQVEEVVGKRQLISLEQINPYLATIIQTYGYFDRIQIIDSSGLVKYGSGRNSEEIGTSVSGQSFFKETLIRQRPYWSSSFISQQTGAPTVTLSLPLNGGMVVGYLNLDVLNMMTGKFRRDVNSHAVITDQHGVAIAHVDGALVAQRMDLKGLEEIQAGLNGFEGTFQRMSEHADGLRELASVVKVPATGWLVVYHQDVDEAFRPLRFMTLVMLITIILTGLLAFGVAFLCLQKVFLPLAQFLQATKGIAFGNYEIAVPTSFTEFNELGRHFSTMVSAIQLRERDLRYRLDFEAMLSQISTSFINLPMGEWQRGVKLALEQVGHFLDVDRAYIFLHADDGLTISCNYEWCGPGTAPCIDALQDIPVVDYAWFYEQFQAEGVVRLSSLSDLPPEARAEYAEFAQEGIQSLLCLPMMSGEQLVGFIGFDQVHRQREWSSDLIAILRLLADLLHQTIQRQQSKLELERLHIAIDQATEFILILDLTGRIEYANPSFIAACGSDVSIPVQGSFFKDLPPAGVSPEAFKVIWGKVGEEQGWHGRLSGQQGDGSALQQEVTISPVRESLGQVTGYVMVGRDISKQLELESHLQQTQKMESIGTLAGGIAHDFNNILAAIIGYVDLASMRLEPGHPSLDDLVQVEKASKRAIELVRQILTFSRKDQKELEPVFIQPIIKEPLKLLRASLPTTIEIKQDIGETGQVMVDVTQLHQVVMNICTNAFHAMSDGGVLEVRLQEVVLAHEDMAAFPGLSSGTFARLTIADTGSGMSQKVMSQIFDPYFTTKDKGKGTGLGLAVVQGIIKSFGGEIMVKSRLGEGTIFIILLPVVKNEMVADVAEEGVVIPQGSERVLLVDDESVLTQLLEAMMRKRGYQVTSFNSSAAALAAFTAGPEQFDIVVSDMTMPELTGLQLATKLKEIRSDIPILICTGYSEGLTKASQEAAGVSLVLRKPVPQRELAVAMRQVLDG